MNIQIFHLLSNEINLITCYFIFAIYENYVLIPINEKNKWQLKQVRPTAELS